MLCAIPMVFWCSKFNRIQLLANWPQNYSRNNKYVWGNQRFPTLKMWMLYAIIHHLHCLLVLIFNRSTIWFHYLTPMPLGAELPVQFKQTPSELISIFLLVKRLCSRSLAIRVNGKMALILRYDYVRPLDIIFLNRPHTYPFDLWSHFLEIRREREEKKTHTHLSLYSSE